MADVVEILSSPDLAPRLARSRPKSSSRQRPKPRSKPSTRPLPGAVIELTESDDEPGPSGSSGSQQRAGPLEKPVLRLPLFLPSDGEDDLPHAAPTVPLNDPGAQRRPAPEPDTLDPAGAIDIAIAQALEVVPDVEPDHLRALVVENLAAHKDQVSERVLQILFEDPAYPRANRKGKGKAKSVEGVDVKVGGAPVSPHAASFSGQRLMFIQGSRYFKAGTST